MEIDKQCFYHYFDNRNGNELLNLNDSVEEVHKNDENNDGNYLTDNHFCR